MRRDLQFLENIPLKDHCTLGIGGPARYFLKVSSIEEMQQAITLCHTQNIPYIILGKGSNTLFDDKGFNGAVLVNHIDFCEELSPGTFHVSAGYSFALLGVQTARKGWEGLEFASGIPASVGGAVYMNAGANGGETGRCVVSVDFITDQGILQTIHKEDIEFSYRSSSFQKMNGAIVGVTFVLSLNGEARKKQIEIVNYRKKTQPYGEKSAGCIFMNPECGSAGALIDQCGLKGVSVGGAKVSEMHANFLINAGDASCDDMKKLIDLVKNRVKERTGIELCSEVRYIDSHIEMAIRDHVL
ncbi:MAG: UDP-N-acetylmuramate dehydrogenase [Parachlamydiaceae bacterium]